MLATLGGCVAITPNLATPTEDAQAKAQRAGPHQSRIYIYRPAAFVAPGPGLLPVIVDTQIVAQIAYGNYTALDLEAGDHVVSTIVQTSVREYNLRLLPGETCYLEAKIKGGVYYYERQPESTAKYAIEGLKLVKTRFKS
jgi:hypothetical protein